jgi:methionyl aminopeptidase
MQHSAMIDIKTPKQIESMKTGGKILSDVLWEVMKAARPGVSELELDTLAEKLIRERGGEPGFQKVPGYKHTICACTNDVVVHGIPSDYRLKEGDVICVDCGVFYEGFHTDMAETVIVDDSGKWQRANGKEYSKRKQFLDFGKKALEAGIKEARIGNRIGHISKAIQDIVEKEGGYSIVRTLIGHGVGRELHEEPEVPGFLLGSLEKTPLLVEGMTIAIEVIYNMGDKNVVYKGNDDWTIVSEDGSISSVFERSVVITKDGPELLTP